ncbi:MAG TPA: MFS transporter [Acidimicrobiia bacterium]|jgi:EmrB/QacA subfamily drug resistance transporter|nr:MFS transporter [Acidimicrobiia bacterium]
MFGMVKQLTDDPTINAPTPGDIVEPGEFAAVEISAAKERSPRIVLLSTGLAVFAVFLDTTVGFVTFPAISATFRAAGPSTVSWVLNAYTLAFAALLIPMGRIADRVGRRKMFLIGVVVFTVGSMLCGLAPTVGVLIGAEVLEAVGAAILIPASLALVLQSFPRERLPVAVAIWGAIGAAAGAAGPVLGAVIVDGLSWRWAFFLNLPVGIVSLLLARVVLPEGREARPGRLPDPLGVVLVTAGVALLTYAIVQTNAWGWRSWGFVIAALAGIALVGLFVLRCRRVDNPLIHLNLFAVRNFRWAGSATLVYAIGFNAMFLGNVLFMTEVWHYSILKAGLGLSVGPAIVALTAPRFGRLAARYGQRVLLVPGGLVWAFGGALLMLRATSHADYVGVFLPAITFTALGVALVLPQLSSAAVQGLPIDQFGAGSAVVSAMRYLGSTFGVALVIAFTTVVGRSLTTHDFHRVWWLLIGCGLTVSLFASRLVRGAPVRDAAAVEV